MIDGLKPYPEYKDSGLPWLGGIPAHWEVRRLKHVAKVNPSKSEAKDILQENSVVTFLPMEKVGSDGRIDAREMRAASDVWNGFTCFRRDDVLIAKITPCFENGKGAYLSKLPTEIGFGSTEFHVLRPNSEVTGKFLHLVTAESSFRRRGADEMTGSAGQQRVPTQFIQNFPVALPPREEQTTIVRFLDHANRRIERYIRAKKKLIALLNEQKQAIIHHAVTRGLDPDVRFKPSGIPWLGDIPEHWESISLGAASELIQTGPFGSQLHSHEYVEGGIPVINPSHMRNGRIVPDMSITIHQSKVSELERHKLRVGDIVAARRGEMGRCGLVTATEQGWICGTGSLRICCKTPLYNSAYLARLFSSQGVRDSLSLSSIGATMDNLNAGMVARLRLPLPPLDEQHRIVRLIEAEESQSGSAPSTVEREIALIREYRTRLVADVVTGQLDVRKAAAKLPEEPEEIEPLNDAETSDDSEKALIGPDLEEDTLEEHV